MSLRDLLRKASGKGVGAAASRELRRMQQLDLQGRALLSNFQAPEGAADRLAEKVTAVETWADLLAQADKSVHPRHKLQALSLSFDVVGHERPTGKLEKKASSKPARSSKSPRQTNAKRKATSPKKRKRNKKKN